MLAAYLFLTKTIIENLFSICDDCLYTISSFGTFLELT